MSFDDLLVYDDIHDERMRQDEKWGPAPDNFLDRKDGTGDEYAAMLAWLARWKCDKAAEAGVLTWRHILNEEVAEAMAESDPDKLRAELIQVAAVAVAWVETIDARST